MSAKPYRRGDIVRESDGTLWLVTEDEGTDKYGQILMRPLGSARYLTRAGKPGRFRKVGDATKGARK
jgi:hypothetical protein